MNVDHLRTEELDYELSLRGYPIDGTVAEKRRRLRSALRFEKDGVSFKQVLVPDADEEIDACRSKVAELRTAVDNFDFSNAVNEQRRLRSRLLHVTGRIQRIVDQKVALAKGQLLVECSDMNDFLEETVLLLDPLQVPNFPSVVPSGADICTNANSKISHGQNHTTCSSPQNRRNVSLIDVNPQDLESAISDLQLNSSAHAAITPVTQTSTTTMASFDNVSSSAWPRVMLPQQVANSHGAYPMFFQPLTGYSVPYQTLNPATYQPYPQQTSGFPTALVGSPTPVADQSARRVSFTGVPDDVTVSGREQRADSRVVESGDRARIFKTVSQWNVKFDGLSSVNDFLEGVEELRIACGFSKQQLIGVAVVLFKEVALNWFRANINPSHSWDELVILLRKAFLPGEYDEDIWADIRARTQGQGERVTTYMAVMQNLFNKLSEKPSEQARLRIIRRNLLPHIQSQMALHNYTSVADLTLACQLIEDSQIRVDRFKPPPTNPVLVTERGLMYNPRKYRQQVDSLDMSVASTTGQVSSGGMSSSVRSNSSQLRRCWNCQQTGHIRRDCPQQAGRCPDCKIPKVTEAACPKCSGNARLAP